MTERFRRLCCLVGMLAVTVLVTGCGSSSNQSSSQATSGAGGSTQTATSASKASIKIGLVCSCSGPEAAATGLFPKVMSAWQSSVNASGGINGHPVDVISIDDGLDPARSVEALKTLVEQDHVLAIIDGSGVDTVWSSYLDKAGIPVVGGLVFEPPFLTDPDFFASGATQVSTTTGAVLLAKAAGKTHLGFMYCAEAPVCAQAVPIVEAISHANGLATSVAKVSATAPSYAAPCLSFKSDGVDVLFVADNNAVVPRIVDGCAQQGYKPFQVALASGAGNNWKVDSNFDGMMLAASNADAGGAGVPGVQTFEQALDKFAPGLRQNAQFSGFDLLPWAGAQLFRDAAEAAHIGPTSSPAAVKQGLYALKNETLDGLAPPLNFIEGKPTFTPCYFTETIKNGSFEALNDNQPTCLPKAAAAAIAKALHLG